MAEKDAYQQTADEEKEDALLTVSDKGSISDEQIQDGADGTVHSEDSSSSSETPNRKNKTAGGEDVEQVDIKEKDCTQAQADDKCHGDGSEEATAEDQAGRKKEPKVISQQICGDREEDEVDGPKETSVTNNNAEAGDGDTSGIEEILPPEEEKKDTTHSETTSTPGKKDTTHSETTSTPGISAEKDDDEQSRVEHIGPTTQDTETTVQVDHGAQGGSWKYLILVAAVVLVAIMVQHLQPESPPQKKDVRQIFLNKMDKLKAQFPNQRAELWKRSQIHLLKHLQCAQPTEPVSLILTAGLRAQRTLRCLAQGLASAFSSALNASVLHIDGASKASQDSDQVKLDLDSTLQGAFEGDKPVAVIHRFEELPPGSTLIFYRYCDHENAAYKKTCLIFTVLLEEEEEIPAKSHLSVVEEMVDDHLQKKFLSDGHPVSFDRMDLDKYGGLWSRISHLILPVAAEERIEREGCEGA